MSLNGGSCTPMSWPATQASRLSKRRVWDRRQKECEPDGPQLRYWREWTTRRFEIDSAATIDVGLDGEALRLEPPLRFESLPARKSWRRRVPAPRHGPAPS